MGTFGIKKNFIHSFKFVKAINSNGLWIACKNNNNHNNNQQPKPPAIKQIKYKNIQIAQNKMILKETQNK